MAKNKYLILIILVGVVLIFSNRPMTQKTTKNLPDGYTYKYGVPCKLTKAGEGTCTENGKIYHFCNYNATEPCRPQE